MVQNLPIQNLTKLLITFLLTLIFITDAQAQCNKVSNISINSITINDASNCPTTMNITVNLSGTIGGGNPSFCIGYIPAGGTIADFVQSLCFNITQTNHNAIFNVPCDAEMAAIVAYSSPSGSGNTCSNPAPVIGGSLLPISLISFKGEVNDLSGTVVLEWATASELNNDFYAVERGGDDLHFVRLGEVPGKGTTNMVSEYRFEDAHPLVGGNYYRLVQYDLDGQFSESKVIAVNYRKNNSNNVSFVKHENMLKVVADDMVQDLDIFTLSGQLIRSYSQNSHNEYDISSLSRGLYIVRIVINAEVKSQKMYIM